MIARVARVSCLVFCVVMIVGPANAKPRDACKKLERRQRTLAGLVDLGNCHFKHGKRLVAHAELERALGRVKYERKGARKRWQSLITKRIALIEASLGRLVVTLSPDNIGDLHITIDGKAFAGSAKFLEPGQYMLRAASPGMHTWESSITIDAGATQTIAVPALESEAPAPPSSPIEDAAPPPTTVAAVEPVATVDTVVASPASQPTPVGVSGSIATAVQLQNEDRQQTVISVVSLGYELSRRLSAFGRFGFIYDAPASEPKATGIANPVVGATYGIPLGAHVKLGLLLGATIPIGSGGGDDPDPTKLRAMLHGTDWGGPMFTPNHVDVFPGLRLGFSAGRFAVQSKATLHHVTRVRGENADPLGARVTFLTSGISVAYSLLSTSVSAGFAETRFLSTPAFVTADPKAREDHFLQGGLAHDFNMTKTFVLSASLLYARAIDEPKTRRAFQVLEAELGFSF